MMDYPRFVSSVNMLLASEWMSAKVSHEDVITLIHCYGYGYRVDVTAKFVVADRERREGAKL